MESPPLIVILLFFLVRTCYGQSNGELRLYRDGQSSYSFTSGRLQIYLNGQWGNICDTGFGLKEAVVACQQLTYNTATSFGNSQTDIFGIDERPALLDQVSCENNDSLHILQCDFSTTPTCSHENDVSVTCSPEHIWDDPHYSQVRLQDGSFPSQGRIEFYLTSWNTVCDDFFGSNEADTVCRQLGYTEALEYDQLELPGSDSNIVTDYTCCYSVQDCFQKCYCSDDDGYKRKKRLFCDHDEDVTVQCTFVIADKDQASKRNQCDNSLTLIIVGSIFGGLVAIILIGTFSALLFCFLKAKFC